MGPQCSEFLFRDFEVARRGEGNALVHAYTKTLQAFTIQLFGFRNSVWPHFAGVFASAPQLSLKADFAETLLVSQADFRNL